MPTCPGCGAPLESAANGKQVKPCLFCGWKPVPKPFPHTEAEVRNRHMADTLPLPTPEADLSEAASDRDQPVPIEAQPDELQMGSEHTDTDAPPLPGPEHFRELLSETRSESSELLEQVPEDMREVLAARIRANENETPEFREETVKQLRAAGYHVTEDSKGARISAIPGIREPAELSPLDVVKMAAELDGGVQKKSKLPFCDNCQSASPIGSTMCQWCGEPLPGS